MKIDDFKLKSEVEDLKIFIENEKKIRKKSSAYKKSRLRKHLAEIVLMRQELNASWPVIQAWLQKKKRIKMSEEGIRSYYNRHKHEILVNVEKE